MADIFSNINNWFPTSSKELKQKGWDNADIILITGDAYIDHPAFGIAIIARLLEKNGYNVAVLPQPNWKDDLRDFKKLGKPRLFFGVTSGNMDSMVNHYTANKRLRHNDAYTPGGRHGARPDYATIVYSNILKKLYPDVPVIIGGIEASLRRIAHYDYWSNSIKPGILIESKADILVYGMGEAPIVNIANQLKSGKHIKSVRNVPQTAYIENSENADYIKLYSYKECRLDKNKFVNNFKLYETESNKIQQNGFIQKHEDVYITINPPVQKKQDLDKIYSLPFTRLPHPRYKDKPEIPAYTMIRHSVTTHRGCFGGCSFCTISAHQGKFINNRSEQSVLDEIKAITQMPDFRGNISDVGGPSANMYKMKGMDQEICMKCTKNSCIFPLICDNLNTDHTPINNLLNKIENQDKIKKVFVGSGIRYDLIYAQKRFFFRKTGAEYLQRVIRKHTSGRLKVAPEHTSGKVLKIMRKPDFSYFKELYRDFYDICKKHGLNQQIIPYFISNHPGCELTDMVDLAINTNELGFKLEQVQDYTPTPMTFANVLYYSGINPHNRKKVYVPRSKSDRQQQQQLMFWYKNENKDFVKKTLINLNKKHYIHQLYRNIKK